MRHNKRLLLLMFGALASSGALAQDPGSAPRPTPPQQPNPQQTIPEQVPPEVRQTPPSVPRDENLSEQLQQNQGVVRPPPSQSEMPVIRPPDPGTTPVIPPRPPGQNPQR